MYIEISTVRFLKAHVISLIFLILKTSKLNTFYKTFYKTCMRNHKYFHISLQLRLLAKLTGQSIWQERIQYACDTLNKKSTNVSVHQTFPEVDARALDRTLARTLPAMAVYQACLRTKHDKLET